MTLKCYNAVLMAQIYQENTFRAFCTLKTVYESQFQFQTTGWKSNHCCEIKPIQGKNSKFHISNPQQFFLVRATTKIKPDSKAQFTEVSEKKGTKLKNLVYVGENYIFSFSFSET